MKIDTALILCAGLGNRLNPLTLSTPKPLLELENISMLERCINLIIKLGIKKILLNTFHLQNQIIKFIRNKKFPIDIQIIEDGEKILDTGGGILSMIKNSNEKLSNVNWIIPTTRLKYNYIISIIKNYKISNITRVVVLEENYELLKHADLAVACSGTITLELVLFKVPTIAVYKTDFLSAFIGRLLVNFQNVILPNFLLSKNIIPFLFQEKFNNVRITNLLIEYIETIDKKKKDFKEYSSMILKNMIYDEPGRIVFSINASKEINKIINNYNY